MADMTRLVDTSILIDFLRGNETANAWLDSFAGGELAISNEKHFRPFPGLRVERPY